MKPHFYFGLFLCVCWLQAGPASSQQQVDRPTPKMEPVAETALLMQAINLPNFQGIEKLLKEKPTEPDAWKFLRGQALLIAENGNLLMLRPPHNAGEAVWQERAAAMRTTAAKLANVFSERDYTRSRAGLIDLASSCNDCHASFRVGARVVPFSQGSESRKLRPGNGSPANTFSPAGKPAPGPEKDSPPDQLTGVK